MEGNLGFQPPLDEDTFVGVWIRTTRNTQKTTYLVGRIRALPTQVKWLSQSTF